MRFIKANLPFLLACIATLTAFIWLVASPDFEPIVTTVVGLITCISLRPKDWMIIRKRNQSELPDFEFNRISVTKNTRRDNIYTEENGLKRFNFDHALSDRDKSIEFSAKPGKYKYSEWSKVPIRVVILSQSNTWGENKHYVYAIVPDKSPVCFYQFEAVCCEICADDVDGDGNLEVVIGYKCGAHTEGLRVFRLDDHFDLISVPGSDIGSDFPLITWGRADGVDYSVNSYSRNWGENREEWHTQIEVYRYRDGKFDLYKSEKVQWQPA
ncbi:hypothetical protein [Motiliproteus sp.]|uniref:hypothetical protein n=1 Tax=Motiliproteus sp. TaxID=1898955 RepID=UPI003BACB1BF